MNQQHMPRVTLPGSVLVLKSPSVYAVMVVHCSESQRTHTHTPCTQFLGLKMAIHAGNTTRIKELC